MKKLSLLAGLLGILFSAFSGCRSDAGAEPEEMRLATELALDWNRLLLDLERHTPGYRPPMSARMFAYVGLAAYESALPALSDHVSAAAFCPGYAQTPAPEAGVFYLPASLNATYAQIARHFFPTAPQHLLDELNRLEQSQAQFFLTKNTAPEQLSRSVAFGRGVADAVWQWSKTDSLGHDGFLYNFDRAYIPPACPGCWQPGGSHPMPALAPHWGKVRSFVVDTAGLPIRAPLPFDEAPGSAFYTEAMEVFSVSQPRSKENLWIAEFWSDDLPGLTMTPAGRWISIASQALAQARPAFPQVIECYLHLGLALHDASVICWYEKYRYNLERPEAYIGRNIQRAWAPLHDSPPFPSYPSGHSAFGAAAAEVLGAALGYEFALTDRTHADRKEFAGAPRHFKSFAAMAQENALSRVAIGVHYRMDCEEGLRIGRIVGQKVVAMPLRREAVRR